MFYFLGPSVWRFKSSLSVLSLSSVEISIASTGVGGELSTLIALPFPSPSPDSQG